MRRFAAPFIGLLFFWVYAEMVPAQTSSTATQAASPDDRIAQIAEASTQFEQPTIRMPQNVGGKKILLIEIKHDFATDMIDSRTAFLLKRAQARVEEGDIGAVLLDIRTPGGYTAHAFTARDALMDMSPVITTCYVRQAISAGSLLMLACDNIFVAPNATLGDAQTVMMGLGQVTSGEKDEALFDKLSAAGRSEWEATAQAKGHRSDVAAAFADRRESVPGINEADRILILTGKEAVAARLAIAEVSNFADLPALLGMADAEIVVFHLSSREKFALLIKMFSGLFLALAVLGIFIEVKSPGFGIPGGLGLLSLGIFFWANYMDMTASWFEIGLFMIGLSLIFAEIVIIPGFGVAGISGICCVGASLFLSMFTVPDLELGWDWAIVSQQIQWPLINLAFAMVVFLIVGALVFRYLPDTILWRRLTLQTAMMADQGYVSVNDNSEWIGREAVARSTLRPGGIVEVDGKRLDAISDGEWIEKGTPVRVIGQDGAQVVVEEVRKK